MALMDVIKFNGLPAKNWVVYKYPGSEFNTQSKLIVGPGQVAVCVHNGKVEAVIENGEHVLSTENFPFIKELIKAAHGGKNPYTMDIYYVNKTLKLDMLWGTKDPIQLIDPKYGIKVRVRARGQFGLKVKDYQLLVSGLIGALPDFAIIEFDRITELFRGMINTKTRDVIGETIIKDNISLLEVSAYTEEIADKCRDKVRTEFDVFGMDLINFYIESINAPEEDIAKLTEILNKKAEFDLMGDERYKTQRTFDVMESAAKNEGNVGGLMGAGLGFGMGMNMMGAAPGVNNNAIQPAANIQCPKCNSMISASAKFCPECGANMKPVCPSCKTQCKAGTKFCPECGTKL